MFQRLLPLLSCAFAQLAITVLDDDSSAINRVGPMRVAEFLGDAQDDSVRVDAAGAVRALLALCEQAKYGSWQRRNTVSR